MSDAQKAEHYDEWHEYFEPLARIRREVVKALPHYKKKYSRIVEQEYGLDFLTGILSRDAEINPEIQNLIRTILEEGDE